MLNFLYRLFLSFNSTSLIIVVFLVKGKYVFDLPEELYFIPTYVSYIIYFLVPVLLTYLSILLANKLSDDNIEVGQVAEIEQANNAFLPSYLGYFFVALSIPYNETLIFVFFILFIFTFFSQTLYFNPLFLLFRYQFYYITTINRVKIFLITKKSIKDPKELDLPSLKRINNFTFIDKGKQL